MAGDTETFGRFILIDKIAVGGMAEIYLARAPGAEGLDRLFALKRILPQHMKDKEFLDMFKSEAKIALNLTQSNIAQIFEFGQEKNQFYLLMEFIEGRDLRDTLSRCAEKREGFTMEQCLYIMAEAAAGLDYAHRCNDKKTGQPLKIIHRDISPQNIMISYEGEVKIIDFGIAKAESRLSGTKAGIVKGKLSYMSPEQTLGQNLDGRSDIFSAGVILWELLTGRRLFDTDDDMQTIQKIRECRIQDMRLFNPRLPEEVCRIVNKALAKDVNYRYISARDFHRDLNSLLNKLNPQFSREELGNTIKRLFSVEIEEFRRKVQNLANEPATTGVQLPAATKTMVPIQVGDDKPTPPGTPLSPVSTGSNFFGDIADQKKSGPTAPPPAKISKLIPIEDSPTPKNTGSGGKSMWDSNALLDGVKIPKKVTPPPTTPSSQALEETQTAFSGMKDATIMGIAVLAFVLAAVGIYFRSSIARVATDRGLAVRTIVVDLGTTLGTSLGITKRESASVALHEDGTEVANSSSKTSSLNSAKVSVRSIPETAEIELNGHDYGRAPADLLIPLNTHVTITIKHEGFTSFKQDFTVNGPKEINVTLQKTAD